MNAPPQAAAGSRRAAAQLRADYLDLHRLARRERSSDPETAVDRRDRSRHGRFHHRDGALTLCGQHARRLIDEVKRFDRTFAWVYARRAEN
jgi:hypothetical protein